MDKRFKDTGFYSHTGAQSGTFCRIIPDENLAENIFIESGYGLGNEREGFLYGMSLEPDPEDDTVYGIAAPVDTGMEMYTLLSTHPSWTELPHDRVSPTHKGEVVDLHSIPTYHQRRCIGSPDVGDVNDVVRELTEGLMSIAEQQTYVPLSERYEEEITTQDAMETFHADVAERFDTDALVHFKLPRTV